MVEILIVISLVGAFVGFTIHVGSSAYERALAANDIERIAGILRRARGLAMGNACLKDSCVLIPAHGVRLSLNEISTFEGSEFSEEAVYDSFPLSSDLVFEPVEVVFLPRLGRPSRAQTIQLTDSLGRVRSISVNDMGMVGVESF